jgi:hypothetical protein
LAFVIGGCRLGSYEHMLWNVKAALDIYKSCAAFTSRNFGKKKYSYVVRAVVPNIGQTSRVNVFCPAVQSHPYFKPVERLFSRAYQLLIADPQLNNQGRFADAANPIAKLQKYLVRGPRFPSCSIPTHLFATQNSDPDCDTPLRAGPPQPHFPQTLPVSQPHALSTPVHVATGPHVGPTDIHCTLEPAPLPSPSKIIPLRRRRRLRFYSPPKPPVLSLLSRCLLRSARLVSSPGGEPARRSAALPSGEISLHRLCSSTRFSFRFVAAMWNLEALFWVVIFLESDGVALPNGKVVRCLGLQTFEAVRFACLGSVSSSFFLTRLADGFWIWFYRG